MANKYNDKKIKESTAMIHKITAALMKNLEQYKAAKAKGDDTSKFMKISKQLMDAKKKWQNELDNQIMQTDKDVELAMTESLKKMEVKKVIKEGHFTTSLTPAEVKSLTAVVTKIDELKATVQAASKTVKNKEIRRMLTVGGLGDASMLRNRMTSIYQLKDLEK